MYRYKLTIEYEGTDYVGWQQQDNGSSVQGALQAAILNFTGTEIVCIGAGRTDAGVHALGQVAHIDLPRLYPTATVRDALNSHLHPAPIGILNVERVAQTFHARFSATKRSYRYVIVNRRTPLTIERGRAWLVNQPLDDVAMSAACNHLVGNHDFTSFRAAECQAKSAIKTLDRLCSIRTGDQLTVTARARSFLHRQVRNIVGTLVMAGQGKILPDYVPTILAARNRSTAGPCAPPDGLYLTTVEYD